MGPNFFIWIAIGIMFAAMIPVSFGYDWPLWIAAPVAGGLAIFSKVREIRRRRTEMSRTFD